VIFGWKRAKKNNDKGKGNRFSGFGVCSDFARGRRSSWKGFGDRGWLRASGFFAALRMTAEAKKAKAEAKSRSKKQKAKAKSKSRSQKQILFGNDNFKSRGIARTTRPSV
jgi:hypothetical protein